MPTAYGASSSVPEGIVYAGGENKDGLQDGVWLLSWNTSAQQINVKALPSLPVKLSNASMASLGSTLYLAGGQTPDGVSSTVYAMDLSTNRQWKKISTLPESFTHGSLVAQSNGDHTCLYLMGGRRKNTGDKVSTLLDMVWEFDLKTSAWRKRAALPAAISAHTAVPSGSSFILLMGGDKGETFSRVESLLWQISSTSDEVEKEKLVRQKEELLESHPGFSKEVLLFNTVTNVWTVIDTLPEQPQVTTQAFWWKEQLVIPSGEIRPGVRTDKLTIGTMNKKNLFSLVDVLVLAVCFLLMTVARYFFTSSKTTTADYFKGGQKIPRWAAGISIFGAKLSAITFMGIPAKTYGTNWTYFFLLMTIIMIMPVVATFFIPFYRKLNVTSAYEYLEKRFNYATRISASILYILLQLGRMGIVILLPSIALMLVTGIDVTICILMIGAISIFFTVKGGIEAVIWVEVIQVLILAGGALLCLFYLPFQLHDAGSWFTILQDNNKLKVIDARLNITEPTLWVVLIGGLAINLVTYGTDQTTVQRYLTTKDEKESVKSLKLGAWLTLPSTLVFFTIGTFLYLFFRQQPSAVNYTLQNQDNIFPWYIVSQLPVGLSGLLIAGIFAAAMSSTEASMNSVATLLTTDVYKKIKGEVSEKQQLFFARACTLLVGIFVTVVALYMAHNGMSSLWDKFNTILGLFTGTIGGMFLLGILTTRATGKGVVAGMLISFICQLLIFWFTPVHFLLFAFTGLISCVIFGYLFSLLWPEHRNSIEALTIHA